MEGKWNMKKMMLVLVCLMYFVTACGVSPEEQSTMTATALTATAASWTKTPTATLTSTATSTLIPTKTTTPTKTPDPGRYYSRDKTFSFVALEGWDEVDVGYDYPNLLGPQAGGFRINMIFVQERSNFPAAFYSAIVQDSITENNQSVKQISEDFLTTKEGKDYFRWEITFVYDGNTYRQMYYFYDSDPWVLVIKYTRLDSAGAEYDALVDASMETVQFKR
jgi:hypothetical protein